MMDIKKSMDNKTYKEIGKLTIEGKTYPVLFNGQDGKTYYLKNGTYFFIDWNWTG